jgi:hypothetical protein
MSADNGDRVETRQVDVLTLTFDAVADTMEISGRCNSTDRMIDMVHRATRLLEHQWKMEQIKVAQQSAIDAARTQSILNKVAGRTGA